jgi:uncharacterized protein YndB with AHSA1/START domain
MTDNTPAATKDLVIERIFDAPRELVWRAWTEPEHFMRWWGPKDFTSPECQIDLRVGGKYLFCMQWPDGRKNWTTGTYEEIIPLEKIVFSDHFADEDGNIVPATHYGLSEDFPTRTLVTVTFEDLGGKTRMTLTHAGMLAGEMGEMAGEGWDQSFDKMAASLQAA